MHLDILTIQLDSIIDRANFPRVIGGSRGPRCVHSGIVVHHFDIASLMT